MPTPEDDELDRLLTQWGQQHQLSVERSEQIRRFLTTSAPPAEPRPAPSPQWWHDLNARITSVLIDATSPPPPPTLAAAGQPMLAGRGVA